MSLTVLHTRGWWKFSLADIKKIFCRSDRSMVKKLSCVSCGSLKRFPHTFTKLSGDTVYHYIRGAKNILHWYIYCTFNHLGPIWYLEVRNSSNPVSWQELYFETFAQALKGMTESLSFYLLFTICLSTMDNRHVMGTFFLKYQNYWPILVNLGFLGYFQSKFLHKFFHCLSQDEDFPWNN